MGYTTRIAMKNSILTIISLLLFNLQTSAGGFQVNLQGQKQTGMGHAGIGLALDNAAVVFNPGALIFIDSLGSYSAGMNYLNDIIHTCKKTAK